MLSYCMPIGDDDPRGITNLDPRGMIGRIYVGYHLTLLHTKYTNYIGLVVLEKKIFKHFVPL